MAILIPIALVILAAWLIWRSKQSRAPAYLARAEYWVYLPEAKMPSQDAVMTRLVQERPFGEGRIGSKEALLFSDIRFHMGLVRRDRNPKQFRPDLFTPRAEPTTAILEALAAAQGFVTVRYVSEEPLRDERHLRFLPHVAEAVAALGRSEVIYDAVEQRLITLESHRRVLTENPDTAVFDVQVDVDWQVGDGAGSARTYGMTKRGLPDLFAQDCPPDHETLVRELVTEAARTIWKSGEVPEYVDAEAFGDGFRVIVQRRSRDEAAVWMMRRST